ncbi:hypothetical protein EHI46_35210 [Rhizobium leguminosarum]|nr:hypothetical protein EHI46_35210 [Rhizobium leguminosarum]
MSPLCPARHLPHRWGDHKWLNLRAHLPFRPAVTPVVWGSRRAQPISPPVGEMPGRCRTRIDR